MWKRLTRLNHPNVLPLLGITITPFQLISNWMPGGDLLQYVKKNPNTDRLGLVGVPPLVFIPPSLLLQLSDIANGLDYLHSRYVVHGDLKGVRRCSKSHFSTFLTPGQPNVLVDDAGHARIADFGLATLTQNPFSIETPSAQRGYSPRWTAPEVLDEKPYSKEADIFSFAMVMIEVRHRRSNMPRA